MFNAENKQGRNREILSQVAASFVMTKQGSGAAGHSGANYNKIMQSFETLQNYLLSVSDASPELLSADVLASIQDMLRMLPTRDFEFNFLADFFMALN